MQAKQNLLTSSMVASLMAFTLSAPTFAERNPCSPCAPKAKMQHQHDKKNPCAGRNPCAAKNPCSTKSPCPAKNPCAGKNPCAAKKY